MTGIPLGPKFKTSPKPAPAALPKPPEGNPAVTPEQHDPPQLQRGGRLNMRTYTPDPAAIRRQLGLT